MLLAHTTTTIKPNTIVPQYCNTRISVFINIFHTVGCMVTIVIMVTMMMKSLIGSWGQRAGRSTHTYPSCLPMIGIVTVTMTDGDPGVGSPLAVT